MGLSGVRVEVVHVSAYVLGGGISWEELGESLKDSRWSQGPRGSSGP